MAWIPSHTTLWRHAKLADLAETLGCSREECFTRLHFLWLWAMEYAPSGSLKKHSAARISEGAGWTRDPALFVDSLKKCRWIDPNMKLHNWHKYGGRYFKTKELTKQRVRKLRTRTKRVRNAHVRVTDAVRTRDVTRMYASRGEESRIEKTREEKNTGSEVVPQAPVVGPSQPSAPTDPSPELPSAPKHSVETADCPLALPRNFPKTKAEAVRRAEMRNVPAEVAEIEWDKAMATGCIDRDGRPIVRWENHVAVALKYHRDRVAREAAAPNGHATPKPRAFAHESQRPLVVKKIDLNP